MLKAYSVFAEGCRQEHAELVFHLSGKKARSLAWKRPHGDFDCDWIALRVNRMKDADYLADGKTDPFVCHDDAIFRAAGWRGEDFSSCDSCGLTDFSEGDNLQWTVCPECGQCGECGHDGDCISASN
jgi:hypothetical protein